MAVPAVMEILVMARGKAAGHTGISAIFSADPIMGSNGAAVSRTRRAPISGRLRIIYAAATIGKRYMCWATLRIRMHTGII